MSVLNKQNCPIRQVEKNQNGKKVAYCRCWQSKKMPYCDGAHKAYNEVTGDNLGPLIIDGQ